MQNPTDVVINKINDWIKEGDPKLVKIGAPTRLVATMQDGARCFYSFTNEEFFISGARMSGQKDIIFDLVPADARAWSNVEILDKTACAVIEGFEARFAVAMGFGEKTTLGRVKGALRRNAEKELKETEFKSNVASYGETSAWGIF